MFIVLLVPITFVKALSDQVVEDEMTATFECEVNKPNMAAHWSKNGSRIQQSDKYHITMDGTKHKLEIKECQTFDTGAVEVTIEDVTSTASLMVETVSIDLLKPLEDIISEETPNTIAFSCEFSKEDLPVHWLKDGKPIDMTRRHNLLTAASTYSLEIKNATPADEGEYSLTAKGVTTKAKLQFLIKPSLKVAKKYEDVVVIKAGQTTVFEVPFVGYPLPTVGWLYKGKELPKLKRLDVETSAEVTSLKLKQAERVDRGTYSCTATNQVCEVSADITLDVLDRPDSPENFRVTDVDEESVSMEWDEPKDNGGSDVIYYLIDKKEVAKRSYAQVAKSVNRKVTIDNLREGHSYLFQVTAVNDIGKSEPVELQNPVLPTSKYSE